MRIYFFLFSLFFCLSLSSQPDFKSWDGFVAKYVTTKGEVNYSAIKSNSKELQNIISYFSTTKVASSWSKNDQLAFWINAYNAYTIHLIVQNYPIKSIKDLDKGKPWDVKRLTIGGTKYSLNNVENDIIRPKFKDARIHFAVNCGAKSCPPLLNEAFVGANLDAQLDKMSKQFVNGSGVVKNTENQITVSRIFDWYKDDFGNVVSFINTYRTQNVNKNAAVKYLDYDWSLNQK